MNNPKNHKDMEEKKDNKPMTKEEVVDATLKAALKDAEFKVDYHTTELQKAMMLVEGLIELKQKHTGK